ncbi:LLM class flavin-dependent oxidoreductase [Fischerella sp. FACHB-380]|nr:LLM class flavin-dependent oxidoreductase [Fischerella sp. FACHB-380]
MKTGLFCNYEDNHQSVQRAISEQVTLIQHAESLGFEEAWVTEHHFNDFSVSSSILVLLAHLAAVTSTIRLGSAAVLLAFHNPILVAESIATLDHLCYGRLALGIISFWMERICAANSCRVEALSRYRKTNHIA